MGRNEIVDRRDAAVEAIDAIEAGNTTTEEAVILHYRVAENLAVIAASHQPSKSDSPWQAYIRDLIARDVDALRDRARRAVGSGS